MLLKNIHSRPLVVTALAIAAFFISILSSSIVHMAGLHMEELATHFLEAILLASMVSGISWIFLGKIEQLNLLLKVQALAAEEARFEQIKREEMNKAEQLIKEEKAHTLNRIEDERRAVQHAIMMASYHYLNNALNQFQLVFIQLEDTGTVDKRLVEEIKAQMDKTAQEMFEFGSLENPTIENVEKFINARL